MKFVENLILLTNVGTYMYHIYYYGSYTHCIWLKYRPDINFEQGCILRYKYLPWFQQ